jgi:hypothetical protein
MTLQLVVTVVSLVAVMTALFAVRRGGPLIWLNVWALALASYTAVVFGLAVLGVLSVSGSPSSVGYYMRPFWVAVMVYIILVIWAARKRGE